MYGLRITKGEKTTMGFLAAVLLAVLQGENFQGQGPYFLAIGIC